MHKRSLSFFSISYGLSNSLFEVPMVFSFWLLHRSVLSWTSTIFLSGKSFNLLFFLRFALLVCFISMIFLSHQQMYDFYVSQSQPWLQGLQLLCFSNFFFFVNAFHYFLQVALEMGCIFFFSMFLSFFDRAIAIEFSLQQSIPIDDSLFILMSCCCLEWKESKFYL